jgi:hypothetical protein
MGNMHSDRRKVLQRLFTKQDDQEMPVVLPDRTFQFIYAGSKQPFEIMKNPNRKPAPT